MDYEKEFESMNNTIETFKPETGMYNIIILDEPEETKYVNDDNTTIDQIKLNVEVEKKQYTWFISKGKTTNSLYGQLIIIGKHKSKLAGEQITLLVNEVKDNNKSRKRYTITQAIKLLEKDKIKEEKVI